jgi:hypothetical protein
MFLTRNDNMSTQTSEVSQEEAQRLGFRPPTPSAVPQPVAATTNVLGYFNNNPWPVHIAISQLGISIHLDQRGHYVADRQGHKINDPILDQYVGPGQLDREVSNQPVPVRYFARPENRPTNDRHVVREATAFQQTPHGVRPIMAPIRPEAPVVQQHTAPVVGMSMEEARALNLIRPVTEAKESDVTDTTGAPTRGDSLLTIEEATPRDMNPGEYRRWLQTQQGQQAARERQAVVAATSAPLKSAVPVAPPAPRPAAPKPVSTAVPLSNIVGATPLVVGAPPSQPLEPIFEDAPESYMPLPAAAPENAAQAALQQSIMSAAADSTVMEDAVEAAMRSSAPAEAPAIVNPAGQPVTAQPLSQPVAEIRLPAPNIPAASATTAPVPAGPKARFVCVVDGKEFDYRSQLKRYAETKFPDRVDEILTPYPATR